jgi:hypothetical protein
VSASRLPVANVPVVEVERAAHADDTAAHWCRELGARHRLRDESARHEAAALGAHHRDRQIAVRRRWPSIAAAMRALVESYNDGAGVEILSVVDYAARESRDLILEVVARGGQTLTMELDGDGLCVRPNAGTAGAPDGGLRWLTFDLSDDDTAASALQPWLTQL